MACSAYFQAVYFQTCVLHSEAGHCKQWCGRYTAITHTSWHVQYNSRVAAYQGLAVLTTGAPCPPAVFHFLRGGNSRPGVKSCRQGWLRHRNLVCRICHGTWRDIIRKSSSAQFCGQLASFHVHVPPCAVPVRPVIHAESSSKPHKSSARPQLPTALLTLSIPGL